MLIPEGLVPSHGDDVAIEIINERHVLKVSQKELAEIVGCSQSALSKLERGAQGIDSSLICKVAEVMDLNLLGTISPPRITSVAVGMRRLLQEDPPDTSLAFRILSRFTGQWRSLANASDKLEAVSTRPLSTSDQRFDALLAGYVEHLCVTDEIQAPAWVYLNAYYLERFWWRTPLASMRAIEMAETPGALSNRKVFTSARSLESV